MPDDHAPLMPFTGRSQHPFILRGTPHRVKALKLHYLAERDPDVRNEVLATQMACPIRSESIQRLPSNLCRQHFTCNVKVSCAISAPSTFLLIMATDDEIDNMVASPRYRGRNNDVG